MAVVQQAAVLYRMSEFIDLVKKNSPKGAFFYNDKKHASGVRICLRLRIKPFWKLSLPNVKSCVRHVF